MVKVHNITEEKCPHEIQHFVQQIYTSKKNSFRKGRSCFGIGDVCSALDAVMIGTRTLLWFLSAQPRVKALHIGMNGVIQGKKSFM